MRKCVIPGHGTLDHPRVRLQTAQIRFTLVAENDNCDDLGEATVNLLDLLDRRDDMQTVKVSWAWDLPSGGIVPRVCSLL